MHIVLLESLGISPEILKTYTDSLEARGHQVSVYERTADQDRIAREAADADVLILANMPLSWEAIQEAGHLKFIDVAFTGTDHIPLAQACAKGIQVACSSGYATDAVAELAIGLMISLLRSVPEVSLACRQGRTKAGFAARLLKGKTVGFVGAGAIAARTAALAKAFGAHTLGYRRQSLTDPAFDEQTGLDELLHRSDIVSVHVPLTDETRGLIGARELELMKPEALLVNTARGPVVDAAALKEALDAGRIAGAAVDVFETEPPLDPDMPLLQARNLLVTPHIGFFTEESMNERARIVFENLDCWLEGHPVRLVKN